MCSPFLLFAVNPFAVNRPAFSMPVPRSPSTELGDATALIGYMASPFPAALAPQCSPQRGPPLFCAPAVEVRTQLCLLPLALLRVFFQS